MRSDFPRRAGGLAGGPHRGSNDRMIDARKRYVALFGGMGACMVGMALAGLPFVGTILAFEGVDAFRRRILATVLLLLASIPVLLAGLR